MRNPTGNLDPLLARLVEETITPDELTELESLLDGDKAAQERYLHYLALHAELTQSSSLATSSGEPSNITRLSRQQFSALIGLAAAVLMLAALLFLRPTTPAPIATLSEFDGAIRWTSNSGDIADDLQTGSPLSGGTLESFAADAWAEFTFLDGSVVSVSGRSAITITEKNGQKILRLREGNLSIDAAPQSVDAPMLLITPSAEVEVLGTQFNVTTTSFSTRVAVNEGLVRVKRLADGSVQEVAADHHVVAALEQKTNFVSIPRKKFTRSWTSKFPRDVLQGEWVPGNEANPGSLQARPRLWKGARGLRANPILLHTAVVNPSTGERPPVRLTDDARFRIRGRLDTSHEVLIGFATHRLRGGFSGKFSTRRNIEIDEASNGQFEVELSVHDFPRKKDCFPESPIGHEIVYLWIQTVIEDAGLEIFSVELGE